MNWTNIFLNSGLRKMKVIDGVTKEVIFIGKKEVVDNWSRTR